MAAKGPSMDLSSFQDIMTCILGILILIILLTGIDASQIVVLVATPKQASEDDRRPILFECRHNQLFRIDPEQLKSLCDAKTAQLWENAGGNESEFLKSAAQVSIKVPGYRLDYAMSLTGRYLLYPDMAAEGYSFGDYRKETTNDWFGAQIIKVNPYDQFVCFFVRPDSFRVFQEARAVAWGRGCLIACELQQERNPIIVGDMSGDRLLPQ